MMEKTTLLAALIVCFFALSIIQCPAFASDPLKGIDAGKGDSPSAQKIERLLFQTNTIARVYNNPPQKTSFGLNRPTRITKIATYHWNEGKGDEPGTIGLMDVFRRQSMGTWNVTASKNMFDLSPGAVWPAQGEGPPYRYWTVQPNVDLPAGTYEIVDSNPSTWSHNSEIGNRGVAWVYGIADEGIKDEASSVLSGTANAKDYYKKGDSHLQGGDYKKAVAEFTKAIEVNPRYAKAYLGRGDAYSGLEKAKEAVSDYTKYLGLNPKDTFGYLKRAAAYSYAGDLQKAIEDLDKVLAEFPKEANLYYQRGTYYEALGKEKQAIEDYKKAAKLGYGIAEDELRTRGIKWE
ncbi:MAG TPA: tetratricopeptide repeat protein [Thermodesulfovibrionales bacterium]|nr:tetratricopeptide repeat protein [Thermodesulfovibrionales bacterium]